MASREVSRDVRRREVADLHAYVVPITPKMLRETLCVAQTGLGALALKGVKNAGGSMQTHIDRLSVLIAEIDRMRPIGPDGKHDDRHTPTCGCKP